MLMRLADPVALETGTGLAQARGLQLKGAKAKISSIKLHCARNPQPASPSLQYAMVNRDHCQEKASG
jgi:hypothetical protein